MSILLIADLHLNEERPDITEAFLLFLRTKVPDCESLYILGDFFNVWLGDDAMGHFEKKIAASLSQVAETGVKIYIMHGNRDFAIGKTFCKLAGCELLNDPSQVDFYQQPVLLSHGDIFCTKDISYQRTRRLLRNPFILYVLRLLPVRIRKYIAVQIRTKSKHKRTQKKAEIMDVTPEVILSTLEQYQLQLLIHGHTHRPAVHQLVVNGKPAQRIVLGDWEPNGQVLRVTRDGYFLEAALDP